MSAGAGAYSVEGGMSLTGSVRQFTVDDLANLPEDGKRYEVIEGELYVSAAPDQLPAMLIDPATEERDGQWHLPPALVVEVLSPGAANSEGDRATKRMLYARQGVREYWIIDPAQRSVAVFRQAAGVLRPVASLAVTDQLTSPHLPGFGLAITALFEEEGERVTP